MSCSFLPLPRIRKLSFRGSFLFHAHFLRGKGLKRPTLYQAGTVYKKEYMADSKHIM